MFRLPLPPMSLPRRTFDSSVEITVITVIANAATTAPAMMPMRVHSCFFVSFFFLLPAETAPRLTCCAPSCALPQNGQTG